MCMYKRPVIWDTTVCMYLCYSVVISCGLMIINNGCAENTFSETENVSENYRFFHMYNSM